MNMKLSSKFKYFMLNFRFELPPENNSNQLIHSSFPPTDNSTTLTHPSFPQVIRKHEAGNSKWKTLTRLVNNGNL